MGTMEIPEAFANAFIALANDMNDHEDELDLGLSDNHTRLYLSNGCPGFSPYLRLTLIGADAVAAEVCCDDNRRLEDGTWEITRGEIQAATAGRSCRPRRRRTPCARMLVDNALRPLGGGETAVGPLRRP